MDSISKRKPRSSPRASPLRASPARRRSSIKKSPRKVVSLEDHQLVQADVLDQFIHQYAESRGKKLTPQELKKLKQKLIMN